MAMSKFTKGPWVRRKNEIGIIDQSDTQSYGMMLVIARVDEYDFKDDYEANANLIASAPDMYDALVNLMEYLETDNMKNLNMNLARKALAKADGKGE
jgi:hypothetical protein